jgi:hypothetical protein
MEVCALQHDQRFATVAWRETVIARVFICELCDCSPCHPSWLRQPLLCVVLSSC